MANHLTPTELAREAGLERREVISKCMEMGVPIFQGRIDKALFLDNLRHLETAPPASRRGVAGSPVGPRAGVRYVGGGPTSRPAAAASPAGAQRRLPVEGPRVRSRRRWPGGSACGSAPAGRLTARRLQRKPRVFAPMIAPRASFDDRAALPPDPAPAARPSDRIHAGGSVRLRSGYPWPRVRSRGAVKIATLLACVALVPAAAIAASSAGSGSTGDRWRDRAAVARADRRRAARPATPARPATRRDRPHGRHRPHRHDRPHRRDRPHRARPASTDATTSRRQITPLSTTPLAHSSVAHLQEVMAQAMKPLGGELERLRRRSRQRRGPLRPGRRRPPQPGLGREALHADDGARQLRPRRHARDERLRRRHARARRHVHRQPLPPRRRRPDVRRLRVHQGELRRRRHDRRRARDEADRGAAPAQGRRLDHRR